MNVTGGSHNVIRFSGQPEKPEQAKKAAVPADDKEMDKVHQMADRFFLRPKGPDSPFITVTVPGETFKQLNFLTQFRMSKQEEVLKTAITIFKRLDELRMKGHTFKLAMIKHTPKPNPSFEGEDWLTIYDLTETRQFSKMSKMKHAVSHAWSAISKKSRDKHVIALPFTQKDMADLQHLAVSRRTSLPNMVADAVDVLYRATQAKIDNPGLRFEMYGDKQQIRDSHYTTDAYHVIEIEDFPLPGMKKQHDPPSPPSSS